MATTCSQPDCQVEAHCRGLCRPHYQRLRYLGQLPPKYRKRNPNGQCSEPGCSRSIKARGLCALHYAKQRESSGKPCSVESCDRPVLARNLCNLHYARFKNHGDPLALPVWVDLAKQAPVGTRLCRTCMEFKPLSQFRIRSNRPDKPRASKCKPCVAKDWQDNRERNLAAKAALNYGITAERYAKMMCSPCDVCGTPPPTNGQRRHHIDHCHRTGLVRGVLCHPCNTALGLAGESAERLLALAAYLQKG